MWNILLLFLVLCATGQSDGASPVRVTTFYESLCPDSRRFFVRQLAPVYKSLGDIMAVEVHAFGKATSTPRAGGEGYTFKCQHGPDECHGNMVLTCAKKWISDHDTYLRFAFCIMGADSPSTAGPSCSAEIGVPYDRIAKCSTSTEGEILLNEVAHLQSKLNPAVYYVPWIIINDVFSDDVLFAAELNLKKIVCDSYKGIRHSNCPPL